MTSGMTKVLTQILLTGGAKLIVLDLCPAGTALEATSLIVIFVLTNVMTVSLSEMRTVMTRYQTLTDGDASQAVRVGISMDGIVFQPLQVLVQI